MPESSNLALLIMSPARWWGEQVSIIDRWFLHIYGHVINRQINVALGKTEQPDFRAQFPLAG
ncbi:hypothetical protein [Cupriavidus sp. DF5525]|uniref:hypothetical protein n=1 Tax=Cupriavidus sp. DF5525 TaxID=3160989 RepID=UPI0035A9232A